LLRKYVKIYRNYYSKTKKTVKAFQKAHVLKADGKAGPETIAALGGTYRA
jgi:peptidoglycan hydrolase-like protein with peptidoglycan-binding domain